MQTGFYLYRRAATEKKEKLLVRAMEADGQSTLKKQFKQQHAGGEIAEKKTIFLEEEKLKKKNKAGYRGAAGESESGEIWRAGDILGSLLMTEDSNIKVFTSLPKPSTSPSHPGFTVV